MRARGLWITALLVAVAFPAYADKPPGKGASAGAAEAKRNKAGSNKKAAAKRSGQEKGKPKAAGGKAKAAEAKTGAGPGKKGQGARKNPGRPESSDDVVGKAKGLDKERSDSEEAEAENEDAEEAREEKRERRERKKERVEKLKKKWGESLAHPSVVASLKVHARRMARLERVRKLAEEAGKDKLLKRVDELMDKEDERHQRHMKVLANRGSKGKALGKERGGKGPAARPDERGKPPGAGKPGAGPGAPGRMGKANRGKGQANKEAKQ